MALKEEIPDKITKNITITMDLRHARMSLGMAGFGFREMEQATDQKVFETVMSLLSAYGITFQELSLNKEQDFTEEQERALDKGLSFNTMVQSAQERSAKQSCKQSKEKEPHHTR